MSDARHVGTPEWLTLEPGETVRLRAGPSRNLLLAGIGGGMALLVVVSVVVAALGDVSTGRALSFAVVVLVVAGLAGVYAVVDRWEYAVTSDRACVTTGLVSHERRSVALADVEAVEVDRSWWHRLVGVGDLLLVTDEERLRFALVAAPHRVGERVRAAVESA